MSRDNRIGTNRRRFLKTTGAAGIAATLAGCPQGDGEGDGDATPTGDGDGDGDATPTGDGGGDDTATDDGGDGGDGEVTRGGTWTIALPQAPDSLNPYASNSAYSEAIYASVYTTGIYVDPYNFEVHPWVYTDWTVENADSDNPDVYFNVQTDGLQWTDGEDFTLDDVLFSHNYVLDQQPGGWGFYFNSVDSVEEPDNDWDVHLSMSGQNSTWESNLLGVYLLPQHKWEGQNYTEYQPTQNDGPVGLGYGEVTQYNPDTSMEVQFQNDGEYQLTQQDWLEEHDQLRAGGPFLDAIRFRVYSEQQQMIQAFHNGDVDTIYNEMPTQGLDQVEQADDREIIEGYDDGYGFVSFNMRRQPFDDITFRQVFGFLWDDVYWTDRLSGGNALEGDFVVTPGYPKGRPETSDDNIELLEDPATQAFSFRQAQEGVPDYEAIRSFLTEGQVIDGSEGTYVGQEYPGSITGVTASQQEAKYDYSFTEDVQSEVLQDAGANQELLVNGQPITEIHDGPLEYHSYPPATLPELTQMDEAYVQNLQQLGIPVERSVLEFNTLTTEVFQNENFDITHLGWSSPPFPASSLYSLFHSDAADDHSEVEEGTEQENAQTVFQNQTGYGLFDDATADDLIEQARFTMDPEERDQNTWEAVEKIYLDFPYMVYQYSLLQWPVNTADFSGYVRDIVAPGGGYIGEQYLNVHQSE